MTDVFAGLKATPRWQHADPDRVDLGRFRTTGPLAWSLSRLGGALTRGGRVQAIEALGLVPGILKFYLPFVGYVNALNRLSRSDTELVILRTAWNCGAYYEWYQHVYVSGMAGLSVDDVERVGLGPDAAGWTDAQRALLTAVDELTSSRFVTDETWASLREHYDDRKLVDICLLTGNYAMLAMLFKSMGLAPEQGSWTSGPLSRLRRDQDVSAPLATDEAVISQDGSGRTAPALPEPAEGTGIVARLAADPHWHSGGPERVPSGALRDVGPLTWVISNVVGLVTRGGRLVAADAIGLDPRMMRHYAPFALRLVLGSHLTRTDTELATMRITWNSGVRYEWFYHAQLSRLSGVAPDTVERVAQGPSAEGWNERQRALLTAVDELHADRMISDATWSRLSEYYDERKLAALCLLVGHYDMLAMLFRTYGVEPEPGALESGLLGWLRRDDDSDRIMPPWQPAVNKVLTNRLAKPVARRLPLLGVVLHRGRNSGRQYETPVLVLREGNTVVIPLAYGDKADWVRNVLAGGGAELRSGGRTLAMSAVSVRDRTGCDDLALPGRVASRIAKVLVAEVR